MSHLNDRFDSLYLSHKEMPRKGSTLSDMRFVLVRFSALLSFYRKGVK